MTSIPRDLLWKRIVFAALALGVVLLLFAQPKGWLAVIGPLHNVQTTGYPFGDMNARLAVAEGVANGIDVNHEDNPYSRYRAYNNKPLYTLHVMAFLGLDRAETIPVGVTFVTLAVLWSLWLLRPRRWVEVPLMLMVFLSPPCLLLFERSNDDIIIFCGLMAVPLLLEMKRAGWPGVAAWSIISLLTPMKYYPAAAYALFMHRGKGFLRLVGVVAGTAVFLGVYVLLIWDEFQVIRERIPDPTTNFSFGGRLFFEAVLGDPGLARLLSYGLFGVILLLVLLIFIQRPHTAEARFNSRNERYFLLGSALLTFCFILSSNWDYRMFFLIPTLPLALEILREACGRMRLLSVVYLVSAAFTLWPEYLYFWSCMNSWDYNWTIDIVDYRRVISLKHGASWVMMASNILIAAMVLRHDVWDLWDEAQSLSADAQSASETPAA